MTRLRYAVLIAGLLLHAVPASAQLVPPGFPGARQPGPQTQQQQPTQPGFGAAPGADALLNRNDPISTLRQGTATAAEGGSK